MKKKWGPIESTSQDDENIWVGADPEMNNI